MLVPAVTRRAVALVLLATLCFVSIDALMKHLTHYYNVPFLIWVRYGVQALVLALWLVPRRGLGIVRTRHPWLQIARGTLLTCSSLSFFTSLIYLPLAEAVALNYLAPVIVVVLATLLLGERMTRPRWAMLASCLVGMLLIVRPGSAILGPGAAFALLGAVFYGAFQVITRHLAAEDPLVTLFFPALIGSLGLTLAMPIFWVEGQMPLTHVATVVFCGVLASVGHYLFILAFRAAPASGITPFTYAQLVWATLIGWIAFGDLPDAYALLGMLVIAASGLFLAWRERAARAVVATPPEGAE